MSVCIASQRLVIYLMGFAAQGLLEHDTDCINECCFPPTLDCKLENCIKNESKNINVILVFCVNTES